MRTARQGAANRLQASLGLVFFMFTVGFELDHKHIPQVRSAIAVSLSSVALPFAVGAGLALLLYPANHIVAGQRVGQLPFVLFFGVAISITAFPVLPRILTSLDLHRSRLGTFVMTCAAGADVTAWGVLSFVVAVVVGSSMLHAAVLVGELLAFVMVLVFAVRPLLRVTLSSRMSARSHGKLPLLLIIAGLMLSAWVTTRLGFQPVFGRLAGPASSYTGIEGNGRVAQGTGTGCAAGRAGYQHAQLNV
jgi:Kef-type K+ transport system membrane component KefB